MAMFATQAPARRLDASMTLLNEVMARPLDPSYAAAAARQAAERATEPAGRRHPVRRAAIGIVALLVGVALAAAGNHLYNPLGAARQHRQALEAAVAQRSDALAATTAHLNSVSGEVAALQDGALAATDPLLLAQLALDELQNGSVAATGPGLLITLHDGGGGLTEPGPENLVRDNDLQIVAQALWAAGAEAIAVGDQRLTMTTAIRNAGDAVLVDLVPVLGPDYAVTAIGDPARLEASWANSRAAAYLELLGTEFGIRSSVSREDALTVPSALPPVIRHAEPLG